MREVWEGILVGFGAISAGMLVAAVVGVAANVVGYLRGERYIGWGYREKRIDRR